MKRADLIRHLEQHGCRFVREGGKHVVYLNSEARRSSSVPRHGEINDFLARKIAMTYRFLARSSSQEGC
jgi:predicted RNA binding protein YcfA (HicA-like mRNA interferase family)